MTDTLSDPPGMLTPPDPMLPWTPVDVPALISTAETLNQGSEQNGSLTDRSASSAHTPQQTTTGQPPVKHGHWGQSMAPGHARPPVTFRSSSRSKGAHDQGSPAGSHNSTSHQADPHGASHSTGPQDRLPPITAPLGPASAHLPTQGPAASTQALSWQQQPQQQPFGTSTGYVSGHHSFVPRVARSKSASKPRKGSAVGALLATGVGTPGVTASVVSRAHALALATTDPAEQPGTALGAGAIPGWPGAWGGASSIGDLEALDSILDQLVVLDSRMREALLRGPLVSFETVVPDSRAPALITANPEDEVFSARDRTFMTAVRGITEAEQDDGDEQQEQQQGQPDSTQQEAEPQQGALSQPSGAAVVAVQGGTHRSKQPHRMHYAAPLPHEVQVITADASTQGDPLAVHGAISVPLLPKLAKMYVSSRASAMVKAPPAPAPTAAWLLKSRAQFDASATAPSYDALVDQIKGVQRQYTCGTERARATLASEQARNPANSVQRSALDQYIAGLDGPMLEQVVAHQDPLTMGMDRSRPTFVSMQRAAPRSSRHRRSRSRSKERNPSSGPHTGGHEVAVSVAKAEQAVTESPADDVALSSLAGAQRPDSGSHEAASAEQQQQQDSPADSAPPDRPPSRQHSAPHQAPLQARSRPASGALAGAHDSLAGTPEGAGLTDGPPSGAQVQLKTDNGTTVATGLQLPQQPLPSEHLQRGPHSGSTSATHTSGNSPAMSMRLPGSPAQLGGWDQTEAADFNAEFQVLDEASCATLDQALQ